MWLKWKAAWLAGVAAFRGKDAGVVLNDRQIDAFIQLQNSYLQRKEDVDLHFPDIAFLLRLFWEGGRDWEWFPSLPLAVREPEGRFSAAIRSDMEKYPHNYEIVFSETAVSGKPAHIRLLCPGLRKRTNKQAMAKAKISLHRLPASGGRHDVLDDLRNL